jgi:hypothetical protein
MCFGTSHAGFDQFSSCRRTDDDLRADFNQ